MVEIGLIDGFGLRGEGVDDNLYPGLTKPGDTLTGNAGIGVDGSDHHTGHAGCDDRIDAWWSRAVVGAWLEGHIQSGATGSLPCLLQSNHLRMGTSDTDMGALTHHDTVRVNHDRSDPRIRVGAFGCRQVDGAPHVLGVRHHCSARGGM
jgi:hypothetical protein